MKLSNLVTYYEVSTCRNIYSSEFSVDILSQSRMLYNGVIAAQIISSFLQI